MVVLDTQDYVTKLLYFTLLFTSQNIPRGKAAFFLQILYCPFGTARVEKIIQPIQFYSQYDADGRDIRRYITNPKAGSFTTLEVFILSFCLPAWAGSHLAPFNSQVSPSQICQLWNQEANLKLEENTLKQLICVVLLDSGLRIFPYC